MARKMMTPTERKRPKLPGQKSRGGTSPFDSLAWNKRKESRNETN